MRLRLLLLLIICCTAGTSRASHVMGGEITWKCSGNGYVFELVFFRNCNEADVNTVSDNLKVWFHPTIANIPVAFISREDISPSCSPVPGSPPALDCGAGSEGGNGNGAIEKITYRSAVITLPGVPPPGTGWVFTFESFSRNGDITNLVNPDINGLTVVAKMFALPNGVDGVCRDNSPQFLQNPYLVTCAGEDFNYSMNTVDTDLDSVRVVFAPALDDFSPAAYSPGISPAPLTYEAGFSAGSPTPDASIQAGNVAAQLNSSSGELTFTSNTIGNFVVKVMAQSYREGQLIAETDRELQMVVLTCDAQNNAPDIIPPLAGTFETTVDAGDLVSFTLQATDAENLQDGTPQDNILTASGLMFGTGFTSTTGCITGPCATLDQTPAITGVQGVSTQFSWQTDCAHTVNAFGGTNDITPYHFVFKVQDNYCQVPKTTYRTVTINVRNPGIIPASQINCITTAVNGDVTVSWDAAADPDGTFVNYQLFSIQDGLTGTYPLATTSAVIPAPGDTKDFYLVTTSGCNGNAEMHSDTLSNVFLTVQNPANGTAKLVWSSPAPTIPAGMSSDIIVEREYPAGTWTVIATLPYGDDEFTDTIDICSAFLNYRVSYSSPGCNYNSNIAGGPFEDMLTPTIPVLTAISIDTLTGSVVITWNQNDQPDTYGYVIYVKDPVSGAVIPIDTVWGIANTIYTYSPAVTGPVIYTVSAFDSCFTNATPPTYQTSAKADINTSIYLTHSLNICDHTATLDWTSYGGWGANTGAYTVFVKENNGSWQLLGTSSDNTFETALNPLSSYCFVIRTTNTATLAESFSNLICFTVNGPQPPEIHYLRVATVSGNSVVLRHEISLGTNVSSVVFQKYNPSAGAFMDLATLPATSSTISYTDLAVDVQNNSYKYRTLVVDSCGIRGAASNEANTILLKVTTDQTGLMNYLNWTPYSQFDGSVFQYQIYRAIDGVYDPNSITINPIDARFYEDDISSYGALSGSFCYYIVAQEGDNQYGFSELALSNQACAAIVPLVYIPNAIYPDGVNKIFKPVVSFADLSSYEMTVLDRWGQPVFTTKDANEGWDGTHPASGKLVELGLYSYVVRILDGNDQEYVYRGHVTVIR